MVVNNATQVPVIIITIRLYKSLVKVTCLWKCWLLFFQFRQEYLDTLYRYAKFQYECGNYSGAAEYLYFFRVLVGLQFLSVTLNTINWFPCTSSFFTEYLESLTVLIYIAP